MGRESRNEGVEEFDCELELGAFVEEGVGPEHAADFTEELLVEARDHDNRALRSDSLDAPEHFHAAEAGHLDVQNDGLRPKPLELPNGLKAVTGFGDHVEPG